MSRPIPPPLSLALTVLRSARGWTQRDLAAALGMEDGSTLSGYEKGNHRTLSRLKLEELAAAMDYRPHDIDLVLLALEGLSVRSAGRPSPAPGGAAADRRRAQQAALRLGPAVAQVVESHLVALAQDHRRRTSRRAAAALWQAIEGCSSQQRRFLIENAREFQSWEFCQRLCDESERAAADDATRAIELAQLAWRVAELAPGGEPLRSRHLGYARAFIANGRRVAGDLREAEAELAEAWRLWQAGAAAGDVLPEWRLLDLEASLRRALRQWSVALELHERASAIAPPQHVGIILLNRAATFDQAGEVEKALSALHEAAPLVEASGDPRLLWALRFNLASSLCHLERYEEAEALLPGVQEAADSLGNALDLIRALWLTGRVAAGRGRRQEARTAFEQVRAEFTARRMAYDAALVALEIAALDLLEGRVGAVRRLAAEMAWIFGAKGVHREALAALDLFRRAAHSQQASLDLARRLVSYLERGRNDKDLRFEAAL